MIEWFPCPLVLYIAMIYQGPMTHLCAKFHQDPSKNEEKIMSKTTALYVYDCWWIMIRVVKACVKRKFTICFINQIWEDGFWPVKIYLKTCFSMALIIWAKDNGKHAMVHTIYWLIYLIGLLPRTSDLHLTRKFPEQMSMHINLLIIWIMWM